MEPNRNDLELQLDSLSASDLAYVVERSKSGSDTSAYEAAGYSKSAWFRKPEEDREHLNDLAAQLRKSRVLLAMRALDASAEKAAQVLVKQLDNSDPRVAQKAAIEILDRTAGTPTQNVDVKSAGERIAGAPVVYLPEPEIEPGSDDQ
jgi:hypothetical protein